jgi:hypothetical protein
MYDKVPGFIESLSYSIPDNAPYETDTFQLPKVIEATMGFKYIGKNLQTMQGKHFDLPWLQGTDKTVEGDEYGNGAPSQPRRTSLTNTALDAASVPTVNIPNKTA